MISKSHMAISASAAGEFLLLILQLHAKNNQTRPFRISIVADSHFLRRVTPDRPFVFSCLITVTAWNTSSCIHCYRLTVKLVLLGMNQQLHR
jgi:hypothetical protein